MQHSFIRQGRTKGHIFFAKSESRKCQTLGCTKMSESYKKMSHSNVHWAFDLSNWHPDKNDIISATACIQKEEKERLMKFVFKDDFKASLIGRLLMRKFVAEFNNQNLKYDAIKFIRDDKGKPVLVDPNLQSLSFNVSHQGNYTVMVGNTAGGLLGVDVMRIEFPRGKSLNEYFRLMNRTFSKTEWETIRNEKTERDQMMMFCRHWCLKESYLKAVGIGITINLQDVTFRINSKVLKKDATIDDTEVFHQNEKVANFQFQESLLDDDHCVSVASNVTIDRILFKEIDFDQLMTNSLPLLPIDEAYSLKFFEKLSK